MGSTVNEFKRNSSLPGFNVKFEEKKSTIYDKTRNVIHYGANLKNDAQTQKAISESFTFIILVCTVLNTSRATMLDKARHFLV